MNNIQKRERNALEVLRGVAHFRHLTVKQIGAWVWPSAPEKSATNQAYVLVPELVRQGYLLERLRPDGRKAFVLTNKGAEVLNEHEPGEWARNGYSLTLNLGYGHDQVTDQLTAMRSLEWEVFGSGAVAGGHPRLERFKRFAPYIDGVALDEDGAWHIVLHLKRTGKHFRSADQRYMKLTSTYPAVIIGPESVRAYYERLDAKRFAR